MIGKNVAVSEKNIKMNFDNLFSHINRYYLGSLTSREIDRLNISELPCGAMVYDSINHSLKVLSDQNGEKIWKTIQTT